MYFSHTYREQQQYEPTQLDTSQNYTFKCDIYHRFMTKIYSDFKINKFIAKTEIGWCPPMCSLSCSWLNDPWIDLAYHRKEYRSKSQKRILVTTNPNSISTMLMNFEYLSLIELSASLSFPAE